MEDNNLTDIFIDDLFEMTNRQLPERIFKQAKRCLLDYLGATLAGSRMLESKANSYLNGISNVNGNVTVLGLNRKVDIQSAVLINGINAHVAELDDGMRFGNIHPGAPVISALLPVAEIKNINAKNFLKGIITGYEAAIKLASAIQPAHKEGGYHATGTCGAVGAAIGVASALGFTKKQMKDAFSAAATGASGILKVIEDESELKPLNSGRAALCGLLSAYLAHAGFKGPVDALSGSNGFISVMTNHYNLKELTSNNEELYSIEKIYVKPYAACRHCHPAIDAVLKIRSKNDIELENIKEIKVKTYKLGVKGHDHINIKGVASAKMSTPYSVAVALKTGKAGLEQFMSDQLEDDAIIDLTKKVIVIPDEDLSQLVPHKRAAIVEVNIFDKEQYIERVDLAKGEPENQLTDKELEDKFVSLAIFGRKSEKEARKIIEYVWNLDDEFDKLLHRCF